MFMSPRNARSHTQSLSEMLAYTPTFVVHVRLSVCLHIHQYHYYCCYAYEYNKPKSTMKCDSFAINHEMYEESERALFFSQSLTNDKMENKIYTRKKEINFP